MKPLTALLLASTITLISPQAKADVLLIDAIIESPATSSQGVPHPVTGQSMDQVRQHHGQPAKELPWIGDPPISRWVYSDFTVYFEHQHVITTVVHRKP